MNVTSLDPEPIRCYHTNSGSCTHQDDDGCSNFTVPSVTRSKIGAVLHLAFRLESGDVHYVDIDINLPSITASNSDHYNGSSYEYVQYLEKMKPAQWKTETKKQIDMTTIQSHRGVVKCVKFRSPASGVVLPSQVSINIIIFIFQHSYSRLCSSTDLRHSRVKKETCMCC